MANIDKQVANKSLDGKQKPSLTDNKRVQAGKEDGGMRPDKDNEQKLSDDELDEDIEDGDVDSTDEDAAQTEHDDN